MVTFNPYPRSPHFLCGENADCTIWTGTQRNRCILIRLKCGKYAERMWMGVFGQECGEISTLYLHFSCNTENISAFPILRNPALKQKIFPIPNSPHPSHNAENSPHYSPCNNMENNTENSPRSGWNRGELV